jgi:hypothetical protein
MAYADNSQPLHPDAYASGCNCLVVMRKVMQVGQPNSTWGSWDAFDNLLPYAEIAGGL